MDKRSLSSGRDIRGRKRVTLSDEGNVARALLKHVRKASTQDFEIGVVKVDEEIAKNGKSR